MATCRFCNAVLTNTVLSLGKTPLANSYLTAETLHEMVPFYPLNVFVCDSCFLVQIAEFEKPKNIFSTYAYLSSYSSSWLEHAKEYVDLITQRFGFDSRSLVVELGSNDGYLLQFFQQKGIPVLGIEPAENVAELAISKGIKTEVAFFGTQYAQELVKRNRKPDLLIGNNVLAHVPGLNDFVGGMKLILDKSGVITMEFPHLMRLIEGNQFDTIYHEHYSYYSLHTARKIFAAHDLELFDVEEATVDHLFEEFVGKLDAAAEFSRSHPVVQARCLLNVLEDF